jgi:hypothetical protein
MKTITISDIKQYEKNAKQHPFEQVERIAKSIKSFGCKQPILLDRKNVIVAGHGRFLAFRDVLKYDKVENKATTKKGEEVVPVVYADDLTDNEIKALRIADNQLNAMTTQDLSIIQIELEELKIDGVDISTTGFDESFLQTKQKDNKNGEISDNDLNDRARIVLEFSQEDYMELIDLLGKIKEASHYSSNEEVVSNLIRSYAL